MATDAFWEKSYWIDYESEARLLRALNAFYVDLFEYTGDEDSPRWMKTARGESIVLFSLPHAHDVLVSQECPALSFDGAAEYMPIFPRSRTSGSWELRASFIGKFRSESGFS